MVTNGFHCDDTAGLKGMRQKISAFAARQRGGLRVSDGGNEVLDRDAFECEE